MKKFSLAIIAVLSLAACNKSPADNARESFVKMCKEDPQAQAQGFDCACQADVIKAVLKDNEMTQLIDFIGVEKTDKNKAMEMGKDPAYMPIFKKIAGVGYAIHDKCGKPGSIPAEAAPQPAAPAASAPVTQAPQSVEQTVAPAPKKRGKK